MNHSDAPPSRLGRCCFQLSIRAKLIAGDSLRTYRATVAPVLPVGVCCGVIILTGALAKEYVQLLADLREGKLVRASPPSTAALQAPVHFFGNNAPAPVTVAEEAALPDTVMQACLAFGRGGPAAIAANMNRARQLLAEGVTVSQVVQAIEDGE